MNHKHSHVFVATFFRFRLLSYFIFNFYFTVANSLFNVPHQKRVRQRGVHVLARGTSFSSGVLP